MSTRIKIRTYIHRATGCCDPGTAEIFALEKILPKIGKLKSHLRFEVNDYGALVGIVAFNYLDRKSARKAIIEEIESFFDDLESVLNKGFFSKFKKIN